MANESRTRNSIYNMAAGMGNKMLSMLLTFLSRAIFVKVLSVELLGISGLFSNVLTMLSLAELGIQTAMNYSFYEPVAQNDQIKVAALLQFYRKVYHYIAVAMAVVSIALLPFLNYLVKVEQPVQYLHIYYMIFVADLIVSYLFVYKSCIISAYQKQYMVANVKAITSVLKMGIQIILLLIFKNYMLFILVQVVFTAISNIWVSYKADQLFPFIRQKQKLSEIDKNNILANVKSVAVYKVANVLLGGTDNIFISVLVGTAAVGVFSNYITLCNSLASFFYIIFGALTASIGNLLVLEQDKKKYDIFKVLNMVSFYFTSVIAVSLYFLMQDFICFWVGADLQLDKVTVNVIVLLFYVSNVLQPIYTFREAAGLFRKTKYIMLVTAVLNIILSFVLGRIAGISGIILASIIAKGLTCIWYEPYILYCDLFHKKVRQYWVSQGINVILTLGCILVLHFIPHRLVENDVMNWVLKGFIYSIFITVVYFFRYAKTKEFAILRDIVLCRVKRKK